MVRMIGTFVLVLVLALGATWLADQPGSITIAVGGYEIATNLLVAALGLALFAVVIVFFWLSYHWLIDAPAAISSYIRNRHRRRGNEALSRGMIAAGAGDAATAAREAAIAERQLGDTPMTLLLRAQTAQLRGEEAEAKRLFESMLAKSETESLGLRGLFVLARKEGDVVAARALAERAAALSPQMPWASLALFELQSTDGDWAGALETLEARRRHKLIDRQSANRLGAVLRTAQAQEREADNPAEALDNALEANRLDPQLVPAAVIAARLLAEKGESGRAGRVIERTWRSNPHPDLAAVYGHVRPGETARERLSRMQALAARASGNIEGPIAVARAALEARSFEEAREALVPVLESAPSQRVCSLMAEIEDAENGDRGRVREWLARAVNAPRDPAWTADGFVSATWRPVSPVSGRLDAFEWRVPVEGDERQPPRVSLVTDRDVLEIAPSSASADAGEASSQVVTKTPAAKAASGVADGDAVTKDDVGAISPVVAAGKIAPEPALEIAAEADESAARGAAVAGADGEQASLLPYQPDDPGVGDAEGEEEVATVTAPRSGGNAPAS